MYSYLAHTQSVSLPSSYFRLYRGRHILVNNTYRVFTVFKNNTIPQGRIHWKYLSNEGKQLGANHMQYEIRMLLHVSIKVLRSPEWKSFKYEHIRLRLNLKQRYCISNYNCILKRLSGPTFKVKRRIYFEDMN